MFDDWWTYLTLTYRGRLLLVLVMSFAGGRLLGRLIRIQGARFAARTDTISDDFLVTLVGYTVEWGAYLAGFLTLLSMLGVDITPLLTGAGFAGIVFGLAAREYLANVIGGMIILADRPFTIGERILLPKNMGDLYGNWGDVLALGLRSTKILSTDGVILTIPNSMLINDVVVNFSHTLSPNLRARVQLGVHPSPQNTQKALALLREIINAHPQIKQHPRPPQIIIRELRPHEALLEARFYIELPPQLRPVRSEVFEQFIEGAAAQQIQMSLPQQQLFLQGSWGGAAPIPTGGAMPSDPAEAR